MFVEERRRAKWDTRYTRAGGKACVAVVAVVCGSGRGGAVFQTPRWGIDFGPGRWHRRGTPSRGHRDVVVASVAAALLPPPPPTPPPLPPPPPSPPPPSPSSSSSSPSLQGARERGEPLTASTLAGSRLLAASSTNGVVAVPLDARRRRRRLRARPLHAAPHRADTGGRADTHLRQSRAVERLPVVRGAA